MAVLENRPRRSRGLIIALCAPEQDRAVRPSFGPATSRTTETFWPTEPAQIGPTILLGREPRFKLHQSSWEIFHNPASYVIRVGESSGYPDRAFCAWQATYS